MDIKVYNSDNFSEYAVLCRNLQPNLDIYFDADFLLSDAQLQKGDPEVFCVRNGSSFFIYPYIRRKLPSDENVFSRFSAYSDITAPYGYCGPFSNDRDLFRRGEAAFVDYAKQSLIVSEFVRYHYEAPWRFEVNISNSHNRNILVLDLLQGMESIWTNEFSGTNRNIIRRMEKDGFEFRLHRDERSINEFIDMYSETMNNAGASRFYFFPREFFHNLFATLGDKINLGVVRRDGCAYCAVLFLRHNGFMTYYLSARRIDAFKIPANNYAIYSFIKLGASEGFKLVNFGGGNSAALDDPLFKFKRNFTKQNLPFYIGKRIHNQDVYSAIQEAYINHFGIPAYEAKKNLIQFYRD